MTSRFRKLSHSLYECKYHVVFCPKYRYRIFKDAIGEYVKQQVYQLCKRKEQVVVLKLNVQPDHVHLVVEIPPKYAVSEFMGYLKGKLAIRLFQQYESLSRRYWGRHLWARGYCISTMDWMRRKSESMSNGRRSRKSKSRQCKENCLIENVQ